MPKRPNSVAAFSAFSSRLLREEFARPYGTRPAPRRSVALVLSPPPLPSAIEFGMAPRQLPAQRCVMCDRTASAHGQAIDVGGELVVPACEQIHPGGLIPEGPPDPVVRRPGSLRRRGAEMPLVVARGIAGTLGAPSKLPGASYGIDAKRCIVGSALVKVEGSTCSGCYALKNFYAYWWPAVKARHQRQASLTHQLWPEAMVALMLDYVRRGGERFFRWHDSGDLQSVEHLERIVGIARAVPELQFWLPTREYGIAAAFLAEGGTVPRNLTIRLSAHFVGAPPRIDRAELLKLPTSTVHLPGSPPVPVSERRADTVACRAAARDNHCGPCRAC
jgi:hypothetical protein